MCTCAPLQKGAFFFSLGRKLLKTVPSFGEEQGGEEDGEERKGRVSLLPTTSNKGGSGEELLSFSVDLQRAYCFLRDLCHGRKEAFLKGIILFGTIFLALYWLLGAYYLIGVGQEKATEGLGVIFAEVPFLLRCSGPELLKHAVLFVIGFLGVFFCALLLIINFCSFLWNLSKNPLFSFSQ